MDLADGHIAALRKLFTTENIGELFFFFPCISIWTNWLIFSSSSFSFFFLLSFFYLLSFSSYLLLFFSFFFFFLIFDFLFLVFFCFINYLYWNAYFMPTHTFCHRVSAFGLNSYCKLSIPCMPS